MAKKFILQSHAEKIFWDFFWQIKPTKNSVLMYDLRMDEIGLIHVLLRSKSHVSWLLFKRTFSTLFWEKSRLKSTFPPYTLPPKSLHTPISVYAIKHAWSGVLKLVGAPILLAREILKSANVIFYKKIHYRGSVFFFEEKSLPNFQ